LPAAIHAGAVTDDRRVGIRQVSGAALWGPRRGPWMVGLAVEDRIRFSVLEGPIATCDFSFELPRRPARVADEDPQAIQGLVATEQPQQQRSIAAQVDAVESPDRMLGCLGGAKQEPH